MSALCKKRTHAPQQTSGRALPVVSIVYLSIECPFDKLCGVNCRPKLGAKLLDRFFHGRRHVSPPLNNLTHGFFDGCYHLLNGDVAVSLHHNLILPLHLGLPLTGPCRLFWWRLTSSGAC